MLGAAGLHLVADLPYRAFDRRAVGGVVRGRPDAGVLEPRRRLAGERVEVLDRLDLVAEEDGAVRGLGVGREDIRAAADPEGALAERLVVACVHAVDELAQDLVAVRHVARFSSVTWSLYFCGGEPRP